MSLYLSSGDTALSTGGNNAITLLTVPAGQDISVLVVSFSSVTPAEISLDGGTTWLPIQGVTGGTLLQLQIAPKILPVNGNIQLRRIPGGTDVTGIYAFAF